MSSHRTCGKPCHQAKERKCDCWCGGMFHGEEGRAARDAFVAEFGGRDVPSVEDVGNLFWSRAMAAAHAEHAAQERARLERINAIHPKGEPDRVRE
jgi:hypothetical protein